MILLNLMAKLKFYQHTVLSFLITLATCLLAFWQLSDFLRDERKPLRIFPAQSLDSSDLVANMASPGRP